MWCTARPYKPCKLIYGQEMLTNSLTVSNSVAAPPVPSMASTMLPSPTDNAEQAMAHLHWKSTQSTPLSDNATTSHCSSVMIMMSVWWRRRETVKPAATPPQTHRCWQCWKYRRHVDLSYNIPRQCSNFSVRTVILNLPDSPTICAEIYNTPEAVINW